MPLAKILVMILIIKCTYNVIASPTIDDATITEFRLKNIYTCQARGNPLPTITWTAVDIRSNETVTLPANDTNINAVIQEGGSVVLSDLSLPHGTFDRVSCTADNGIGDVTLLSHEFIRLSNTGI